MHVNKECTNTLIINKSKFICYINKCISEKEYKEYLSNIRKKHYDANHVCSALICGDLKRSSDDGEPSGTAGKPILNMLERNNMNNTCAIVVRYFGGIKLGAGGLIHAYGNSVKECLLNAEKFESIKSNKFKLTISMSLAHKIDNFMTNYTVILSKEYAEEVEYIFTVQDEYTEDIIDRISEYTSGIRPKFIEEIYIDKIVK